jgi:hypothetical protein
MIEWEDGSITKEPLDVIAKDDPVTCAQYAKENQLLDVSGWKRFKRYVKNAKQFQRYINQAVLQSKRQAIKFKFGVRVPKTVKEAKQLDLENGNRLWQDAIDLELHQLDRFNTFRDHGHTRPARGFQMTRVHWVFDVKHDLRHRARMVAGGHLTKAPENMSTYSGVVSIKSFRTVMFLGELNGYPVHATDISNAYLESYTREKIYIIAGPEFGPDREGHALIITKALYGLKVSGKSYYDHFADTLRDQGFTQSKADSEIWMRDAGKDENGVDRDCYEYIAVYVDDLACSLVDPTKFFGMLENDYGYKLKGSGPISYHLGGNFVRDPDGVLKQTAEDYIVKMLGNYKQDYGEEPMKKKAPLPEGDHPELDDTEELDDAGRTQYQSMIGCLQWCVTLGRYDIAYAVMTMSRFRVAPRVGHLERLKQVYGYLRETKDGGLRYDVRKFDWRPDDDAWVFHDWMHSVYGPDLHEQVPYDVPQAKGKEVQMTVFVDANLMYDYASGRSATGIIMYLNSAIIDWYSKRQDTVETATYGSEMIAARIAVEKIIEMRTSLRYLGVQLEPHAYMFGDNQSVVTSTTIPHSKLNKRHNILSYHRIREAIASGMVRFFHCVSETNQADPCTKALNSVKLHSFTKWSLWGYRTNKQFNHKLGKD